MAHVDSTAIDASAAQDAPAPAADAIDEAAAKDAGATAAAAQYPTLGIEAKGADVVKLVNLLNYLGYAKPANPRGKEVLDGFVLEDVKTAQEALGVTADAELGELVGASTWAALYEAAGAKLEASGDKAEGSG